MSERNLAEAWQEIDRIHYAVEKLIEEVRKMQERETARGSAYESAALELDAA